MPARGDAARSAVIVVMRAAALLVRGRGAGRDCTERIGARAPLPGDSVVLAVVARAAPERAVLVIEHDRVDRARRPFPDLDLVPHRRELGSDPRRQVAADDEPARLARLGAERAVHLVAV